MQAVYPAVDLIKKLFESSFLVDTPKGKTYITPGNLFGYKDKYFLLDDVVKGILELIEINHSWKIDLDELHDILYTKYIDDNKLLERIKQKVF